MAQSARTDNFHEKFWIGAVEELWGFDQKQVSTIWQGYMEEKTVKKKMFDHIGVVPPGLWPEGDEGNDLPLDDFSQGYVTHYEHQKFAKRLIFTEEMEYFGQYEVLYDGTRMLSYTEKQTEDYYAVDFLNGAFATTFLGGDGKAHITTDHPLKGGGSWSNEAAVPLAPSNTALGAMLVQIQKTPAENGRLDGFLKGTKIVAPAEQQFRWAEILKSAGKDDTANNAINAMKGKLSGDPVIVPHMTSALNWFVKTNGTNGLTWFWGRKPRLRKISHETNETTIFLGSALWTAGFSDPRDLFGHEWE